MVAYRSGGVSNTAPEIRTSNREKQKMTDYLTKRGKVAYLLFAIAVLGIVASLVTAAAYAVTDGRYFQSTYGMHISRAYEFSDAGMIKDSLEQSLTGIENLGLTPDDSYRILWFTDTKFSRVQTHILEIESVIRATDQVIIWLEDVHESSITKEVGADVYNMKLASIREMVHEIYHHIYRVEQAWILNSQRGWLWIYWMPFVALAFAIPGTIVMVTGDCQLYDFTYNRMRPDAQEKWKKDNKLLGIW